MFLQGKQYGRRWPQSFGKTINQSFCYSTILTSVFSNSLKLPGSFYYIAPKTVSNLIKVPLLAEKMLFRRIEGKIKHSNTSRCNNNPLGCFVALNWQNVICLTRFTCIILIRLNSGDKLQLWSRPSGRRLCWKRDRKTWLNCFLKCLYPSQRKAFYWWSSENF